MGNNFSRPVRHNVRKQGQKPRQHGTTQPSNLSREQLIHRIEMLRERLEENPPADTADLLKQLDSYRQQLKRFD
jgi:hypothetical protein